LIFEYYLKIHRQHSVNLKYDKNGGTLHEDRRIFVTVCLLRIRNVSDKICRENHQISCSIFFQSFRLRENVEKIVVEPHRPQVTIWRMRTACWIPKATNTHSEYVIRIAFPLQQWLNQRASMLRFTYIACLVYNRDGVCLLRGTDWIFKYNSG